mmetsp:Transcript_24779/g.60873  ORF Transcript_24779/g.60873 Transcript_24779/m.60873 type:complete len:369 (+) Transcript_24779:77-1183(+)
MLSIHRVSNSLAHTSRRLVRQRGETVAPFWYSYTTSIGRRLPQNNRVLASSSSSSSSKLYGIRCENTFYQLEEMEDGETSRTEVYLMQDRQVDFGKTDGPVPDYVEGQWSVDSGDDEFTMTIRRVFGTGKRGSDMGEFSFEIVRELRGDLTMVGESVAITGTIVNKDDLLGDKEVGYFNMVDDTEERESYALEGRFKFEIDKTKGLKLSEYTFFASETVGKLRGMFAQEINWNELGPGGYDPNEVFGALPTEMADAFQQQDFDKLESCLQAMPEEEAIYYLDGCINSGLWWTEERVAELQLQQEEYQQQQAAGSGGLDPMEVWETLPPMMQQAFEMQDMTMLETALSFMTTEEADYHMKRCEESGLWG